MELLTATMHTVPTTLRGELLAGNVRAHGRLALRTARRHRRDVAVPDAARGRDGASLTIVVAGALFGLPLHWATVPLVLPVALLGTARVPAARAAARRRGADRQAGREHRDVPDQRPRARRRVVLPVSRCCRLALRWISDVQPLTPALELIRHELVGAPISGSLWAAAAKLAGFASCCAACRCSRSRAQSRFCRARGTLIEY